MPTNCWEFKNCGREPGGAKTAELGVCAAASDARCHGVHGGTNAGRACWLVAGTLCGGLVQGTFASKLGTCLSCDFRKLVEDEQGPNLQPDTTILVTLADPQQMAAAYEDLRQMYTALRETQAQLAAARHLEAVGQLAAGIAHEINTPVQYVGDSLAFLQEAYAGMSRVVGQYRRAADQVRDTAGHEAFARGMRDTEEDVDLDYLESNVPSSLDRCVDGIARISSIVRAMKEFAHPGQHEESSADLNQALRSTLVIAANEYKHVADIETNFAELPPILCHVGELNQVFLNLIVNAAHAIGDVVDGTGTKGRIRIATRVDGESVCVEISDTGSGVPASIRDRIFDPFFTTKEVGKGSGQGLAIARSIVVNKHHGSLTLDSTEGSGATFTVTLPIAGSDNESAEATG
jgi:signal transduction histidine kinase